MSILIDLVRDDFGISGSGRWWRSDIHSSLVVDSEKDIFYFNARNIKGDAVTYLTKVRGISRIDAERLVRNRLLSGTPIEENTSVQVKFEKLVDIFFNSGKSNRQYWYEKGLSDQTVDRFRLGFYDDWYLIPIYDSGKFVNFQCRRDVPEKKVKFWYKDKDFNPVLFNSGILKYVDTVYITEGMVDCLMLNQQGFPSVCSTNGNMSWRPSWISMFNNIKSIYYFPDNDQAGVTGAIRTATLLGEGRVKILRFKNTRKGYGVLNYFCEGNSPEGFVETLKNSSVFAFDKELI